jgi:hypothetical protein
VFVLRISRALDAGALIDTRRSVGHVSAQNNIFFDFFLVSKQTQGDIDVSVEPMD